EADVRDRLHQCITTAGEVPRDQLGVRSPGQYLRPGGWAGSIGLTANPSCATCSDATRIKIAPTAAARPCILHDRDVPPRPHTAAVAHLLQAMLNRNTNPAWQGFHYVDYDLRWDRMERPERTPVLPLLPVRPTGAAGPACARASTGER